MKNKKFIAGVLFILIALVILTSKGQFGRFSFWGARGSADNTAPTCSFATEPTLSYNFINAATVPNYTFSCSDNVELTRVECRLNSEAWITCDSNTSHTITGLTETGSATTNVFKIRAFDSSGNVSAEVNSTNFGVDTTPPTAPTAALTGTDTATLSYSISGGTDSGSSVYGYWFSYDSGTPSYSSFLSPDTLSNNLIGTVYFRAYAIDFAGNTGIAEVTTWNNGNWTAWGSCSGGCGAGGGTQSRTCTNPTPSTSPPGVPCSGSSSQSCNIGTAADNTTDMCTGYKYYVQYLSSPCPGTGLCPQVGSTPDSNITYCTVPFTGVDTCPGSIHANPVSCHNSTATQTQDYACTENGKNFNFAVTCTCD